MDVVGREAIVQESNIEMAQVFPKASAVKVTVAGEFQEERAIMTSMRDMKHSARSSEAIGSGHGSSLLCGLQIVTAKTDGRKTAVTPKNRREFFTMRSNPGGCFGDTRGEHRCEHA